MSTYYKNYLIKTIAILFYQKPHTG